MRHVAERGRRCHAIVAFHNLPLACDATSTDAVEAVMGLWVPDLPLLESVNAPELTAHWLYDIEIVGSMCRFVMVVQKRLAGEWVLEPSFYCNMRTEAVPPAIAMTMHKVGTDVIIPAISMASRRLLMLH